MTTDLDVQYAADVFQDNDAICLDRGAWGESFQLAAVAWLVHGSAPSTAHNIALARACELIATKLGGYVFVLLACHSNWMADSRIVRHRRLWGALKHRGVAIPHDLEAEEHAVESAEGLRYFSAVRVGSADLEAAVAVLHAEPASHLVAMKQTELEIARATAETGWDRPQFGPSMKVLAEVGPVGGIVLWPVGAFDDREAGAVAIGQPEVIAKLK